MARTHTTSRLRVVFLTQDAPFYIARYFERILARLAEAPVEVAAVYGFRSHLPGKGFLGTLWYYFRSYYGPCLFTRLAFRHVLDVLRDRFRRREGGPTNSLRRVCRRQGVPFAAPKRMSGDVKRDLRRLKPDVLFSVGCPVILRRDVIDLPTRATLNIHSALLPTYRGANPVFWARYHGEREIGVTIHLVDNGIDTGDVLMQERIELGEDWSIDDAYEPIFETGSRMMAECLTRLAHTDERPAGRPMGEGPYYGFPTRADVREFRRRGGRFLPLTRPVPASGTTQ